MSELYIHYEDLLACTIHEDKDGIPALTYSPQWRLSNQAFPMSLALEIREEPHRGKAVRSFLENLLPEGEQRRQIEMLAELPSNDDFAFLERFGEDCAGALTISKYSQPQQATRKNTDEIVVSYAAIERAIEEGRPIQYALDIDGELPPFSLAGAQAKFPCIIRDDKIVLPAAGKPTTHIIKLPIRAGEKLLDSVENEYLCMLLAAKSGLDVPQVRIVGEKIPLFCIDRFDRGKDGPNTKRIHIQDICQALGKTSKEKYERHGGPSFAGCYEIVRDNSSRIPADVLSLLDWIGFNLAIGNNDSHAKNLSLIYQDRNLRLAPYYDLICTTLYPQYSQNFAFKIGEVTSWEKVSHKQIESFAKQSGLTAAIVMRRWKEMFLKIETAIPAIKPLAGSNPTLKKSFGKIEKETEKRIATLRRNMEKPKKK